MHLLSRKGLIIGMGLLLMIGPIAKAEGQAPSIVQAKLSLQRLDSKINKLKQQLATAHDQQNVLQSSLVRMDRQLSETERQLSHSTALIKENADKIHRLIEQSQLLTDRLVEQKAVLATYIRARYRIGRDQMMRSMLSSDSLDQTHQRLIAFQYILRAHQQLIKVMQETKRQWTHTKKELEEAYKNAHSLKLKLLAQHQQLRQNKQIQLNIMENLTDNIHSEQRTLQDYEHDKSHLAVLLAGLTMKSHRQVIPRRYAQSPASFLISPLVEEVPMRRWNQGILFVAPEGAVVKAVRGGRVVFSDFLRGYGLLVILDHGQGLMTLYGYNQALFKRRGELVSAGQQIATVGRGARVQEQGLYFEARRDGKVIVWPEREVT